jgi:hypothetical protein
MHMLAVAAEAAPHPALMVPAETHSGARQEPLSCVGAVTILPASAPVPAMVVEHPAQADSDEHLVRLWLARSQSVNTRRIYERQATRFLAHVGKPLAAVRIGDLQDYIAGLTGSSATVALAASALKSLLTFAQEVGYVRFNVGAAVKAPPVKNTLAERIMSEADALLMIRRRSPDLRGVRPALAGYGGPGRCWAGDDPWQGRSDAGGAPVRRYVAGAGRPARRGRGGCARVPVSERRGPRSERGPSRGEGGGRACRPVVGGLRALAAARPRLAQP